MAYLRSTTFVLILVVGIFTISATLPVLALEDNDSAPPSNPPWVVQFYGTTRIGTMVAVIIGCVIVPVGLIGILILMINFCVTTWRQSHQTSSWAPITSMFPQRPRDRPPHNDDAKETVFMELDSGDEVGTEPVEEKAPSAN
ncbi:uncharacterized protein LOC119744341 [Patiria miniata]|uniref:Uncharacterized protein n=1 Tax=Patiria miniata TaxID=46514 RepID=A0A914BKZ3_PATMI|nr:uncharacterized protein LOC119744341 [Patiria miniata]